MSKPVATYQVVHWKKAKSCFLDNEAADHAGKATVTVSPRVLIFAPL